MALLLTSSNMQLESVFVLLLISSPHTASGRFSRKWKSINTEQFMLFSQTYLALARPSDIFQTFCSWFLSENLVMVVNFLMSQSKKKKKKHCSCFKPTEIKAVSCYGQSVCTSVAVTVCSVQCLAFPAVHFTLLYLSSLIRFHLSIHTEQCESKEALVSCFCNYYLKK